MKFDIERLKQLAGVPLNESWDDDGDDGLSPSERKLAAKADSDLKKKGVKVGKVDPDKDLHTLAQRRKAKDAKKEDDEDKEEAEAKAASAKEKADAPKAEPEEKKEAPKAEEKKPEPKKEEPKAEEKKEAAAEAKRRGKAPNPESFNQHAKANAKGMTRGQFLTWAAEKHGKGKAYASAMFAKYNPKSGRAVATDAKECYMIAHPNMSSYMLHENRMMNQMQWVDIESDNEPMIFESKAEAEKVIKYMAEWKSQDAKLVTIQFED